MSGAFRRHLGTIVVAMVTAMVTAGIPATAAIINATKLNGYKANQLVRVAEGLQAGVVLSGPAQDEPVLQTTIKAPGKGYLVMVASAEVFALGLAGTPTAYCRLSIDRDTSPIPVQESQRYLTFPPPLEQRNCATNAAWPVGRGTHTVTLEGTLSAAGMNFRDPTLQVLYVPFGANGKVPTPMSAPGAPVPGLP